MRKEIDILKAFAIIAVVILHFNAFFFSKTVDLNRTIFIDQLMRFCVPLFVALSGYTLAKKYLATPLTLIDFYLRRTTKLIPQYVFWSFVIFFGIQTAFNIPITFNLPDLLNMLLRGQTDYHLYFVPMIFQLYLLFPIIFLLSKRFSWGILGISLAVQILTFNFFNSHPQYSDQEQYRIFITWVFHFTLGIFLAFKETNLSKIKLLFIPILLSIILGFAWNQIDINNSLLKNLNLIIVTKTDRLPIILYSLGIITGGILYGQKLLILPQRIVNLLAFVGVQSYLIYLSHTIFLRIIFAHIAPELNQGNVYILLSFGVAGVIISLSSGLFLSLRSR